MKQNKSLLIVKRRINSRAAIYIRLISILLATALFVSSSHFLVSCSGKRTGQSQFDPEVNYPHLSRFGFTQGDISYLKLSSYESDVFERNFRQSVRSILIGRGMLRVDFSDSPDVLISYTVQERLIIRIVDANSRGLIWRGESGTEIEGPTIDPQEIDQAVAEALAGYPPNND